MLYFLKTQGPRTSKLIFPTFKYTNKQIQIHKYTNTSYDKVPEIRNMCYIFEKLMVQGCQTWYSQMSQVLRDPILDLIWDLKVDIRLLHCPPRFILWHVQIIKRNCACLIALMVQLSCYHVIIVIVKMGAHKYHQERGKHIRIWCCVVLQTRTAPENNNNNSNDTNTKQQLILWCWLKVAPQTRTVPDSTLSAIRL